MLVNKVDQLIIHWFMPITSVRSKVKGITLWWPF